MALFDKNKPFIGVRIYDYFLEVWERIGDLPADSNTIELNENKKTDIESNKTSNIYYPTVKAVFDWVSGLFVKGVASSTDNAIVRFDGATGKILKDSGVIITDNNIVGIGTVNPMAGTGVSTAGSLEVTGYLALSNGRGLIARNAAGNNATTVVRVSSTDDTEIFAFGGRSIIFMGGAKFNGQIIDNAGSSGTNGQVLKKVGELVKWSNNLSSCSVFNTPTAGTQIGVLSLNVKKHDIANEFNTTNNRFTVTAAGLYLLNASVLKLATTETKMYFRKNGTPIGSGASRGVTPINEIMDSTDIVQLSAGDYIDVYISAGQVVTDYQTNKFSATLLS